MFLNFFKYSCTLIITNTCRILKKSLFSPFFKKIKSYKSEFEITSLWNKTFFPVLAIQTRFATNLNFQFYRVFFNFTLPSIFSQYQINVFAHIINF